MNAIDAGQAGRITTITIALGTSAVWVAFWFARWLNDGLQAARDQYESDRIEQDAIEAEQQRARR